MKKILLTIAVCLCVSGLASAQDWSVGGRVGSGLQAVGQYHGFGDVAGKPSISKAVSVCRGAIPEQASWLTLRLWLHGTALSSVITTPVISLPISVPVSRSAVESTMHT